MLLLVGEMYDENYIRMAPSDSSIKRNWSLTRNRKTLEYLFFPPAKDFIVSTTRSLIHRVILIYGIFGTSLLFLFLQTPSTINELLLPYQATGQAQLWIAISA